MATTTWSSEYRKQAEFVRHLNNRLNLSERASVPARLFKSSALVTEAEIVAAWNNLYGEDLAPPAGALVHLLNESGDTLFSTYRRSSRIDDDVSPMNFEHINPELPVAYRILSHTKLAADAASVVINVPSSFVGRGLELIAFVRGSGAVGNLDLTINGVTGANYNLQMLEFQAAAVITYQNTSIATLRINNGVAPATATPVGAYNYIRYLFPSAGKDLTGLAWFQGVLIEGILCYQAAAPAYTASHKSIIRGGGVLESSVPITTITLASTVGNLVKGCEFMLYEVNPQ